MVNISQIPHKVGDLSRPGMPIILTRDDITTQRYPLPAGNQHLIHFEALTRQLSSTLLTVLESFSRYCDPVLCLSVWVVHALSPADIASDRPVVCQLRTYEGFFSSVELVGGHCASLEAIVFWLAVAEGVTWDQAVVQHAGSQRGVP